MTEGMRLKSKGECIKKLDVLALKETKLNGTEELVLFE